MRLLRLTAGLVAVAVVLASMLMVGVGVAAANPGEPLTCARTTGVLACFKRTGDILSATDTVADGYHVEAYAYVNDRDRVYDPCSNYGGNGTTKRCNLNIPEGYEVCVAGKVFDRFRFIRQSGLACVINTNPS